LAAALSTLAEVYAKGLQRELADAVFRESIAMFEATEGKAEIAYVEALQRYATLLRKSRRKTEAAAIQTRADTAAGFQVRTSLPRSSEWIYTDSRAANHEKNLPVVTDGDCRDRRRGAVRRRDAAD